MAIAKFGTVQLGDELRLVQSFPRRSPRKEGELLWSTKALVEESSPNWRWQIEVQVEVVRSDMLELDGYLHELIADVRGLGKQDLVIRQGEPPQTIRTYPGCRLDEVQRTKAGGKAGNNFDASLAFIFTTDQDASS